MANVSTLDTDEELEIHRAVSGDGAELAGHVLGKGPPSVFATGAEVNNT